ncbi:hypothetical protein ACFVR2_03500 [Gottfriedia sp. NPDC057991]|uniref:hypothetical protein n=1 Tax=Gottfriedia sp. NPDC057991 TaxID=3346298 RepID=UPI0036D78013
MGSNKSFDEMNFTSTNKLVKYDEKQQDKQSLPEWFAEFCMFIEIPVELIQLSWAEIDRKVNLIQQEIITGKRNSFNIDDLKKYLLKNIVNALIFMENDENALKHIRHAVKMDVLNFWICNLSKVSVEKKIH